MVNKVESPQAVAKKNRLVFLTECVAAVFPEKDEKRQPKAKIFDMAAKYAVEQEDCPKAWPNIPSLRTLFKNKWPEIRVLLMLQEDIAPVYVNGAAFGEGGGYRKGDLKHVRKQLERDEKIADGVENAADEYAKAAGQVFPQIAGTGRARVSRKK